MGSLAYLTLGFGSACGLGAYLLPGERMGVLLAAALILGLTALGLRKRHQPAGRAFLLGVSLGALWFWGYRLVYLNTALSMDGQAARVSVRAGEYGSKTNYGVSTEGTVTLEGKAYRARIYLKEDRQVAPGDILTGKFLFQSTVSGESKLSSYRKGRGTFLMMYQMEELSFDHSERQTWTDWTAGLRKGLKEILEDSFPADTVPFAKALLLGDTGDLSYELDTDLKISGIRHVTAVSGLHVSILFALVSTLARGRHIVPALVGLPMLLLFASVAGFTPSVTRACLMCALMLVSRMLSREYDSVAALSLAVLVMLLANPLAITDTGLQLSAGSVAGIFLFSGRICRWMTERLTRGDSRKERAIRGICRSVSVTLGAMAFTTPLCALYFGTVSLIGPVTNLLTLGVVGGSFFGILGVCLLHGVLPGLGKALAQGIAWLIRYVQGVAGILADIPFGAVYTRSPYIVFWLIFVYVLLGALVLQRRKTPGVLICCAVTGLCAALMLSWAEPLLDETRVTVLDVGQGQCLLLQSEGYAFLVDCGGDDDGEAADIAAEALLSQGITRLDGLILTHCDRDHAGGVEGLLSRVETSLLILPTGEDASKWKTEGRVLCPEEPMELTFGSGAIRVFPADAPGAGNENSLCILFDTQKCDMLITGDRDSAGERALLESAHISKVDILVAGHHGSQNATCQELLTAVQPDIVCICAGRHNPYGHPSAALLQRLAENGCQVYRTDLGGDILIRR